MARIFIDRRGLDALRAQDGAHPVRYRPPVDVIETTSAIEIVVDLAGVSADSVTATFTEGTLVVAGRKRAPRCAHREAIFHLAERSFGQFACAVRCEVAVDAGRASATLQAGELHIVLPRIEDRRGGDMAITVDAPPGPKRPD